MKRMKLITEEVTSIIVSATMTLPDENAMKMLCIDQCVGFVEDLGCHYILLKNGDIHKPVDDDERGNWFDRFSAMSVVIVIEGGLDSKGNLDKNYTSEQLYCLKDLINYLQEKYPLAELKMHGDLFYGANPVITKEDIFNDTES